MGTEVVRSQECLGDRFGVRHASFDRRRNISDQGNLKNLGTRQKQNKNKNKNKNKENRKTFPRHDQNKISNRKAENSKKSRDGGVSGSRRRDEIDLDKGQTTLLGTAESLDSPEARIKDGNQQIHKSENQIPAVDVTVPESPPEMVPKKIGAESIDAYAGACFFLSPSPRALPFPSFFSNNKKMPENNGGVVPHDTATGDLSPQ